jgi:hypothetical protein
MMKCKGIGRNWLWPNFKVLSWHSLEELRKTTKNSVRMASIRADILNWDLPNVK